MRLGAGERAGDATGPLPISLTDFAARDGQALLRFAYLLCGDRGLAEDLVQDTYLALYRRFGEVLDLAAPVAYARRAIVNAHVSSRRRPMTGRTVLGPVPEAVVDPIDPGEQDAMWRRLDRLPARQRSVLVLRYYLDYPDSDIARLLGCREATVRSAATRAFATLRRDPSLRQGPEAR